MMQIFFTVIKGFLSLHKRTNVDADKRLTDIVMGLVCYANALWVLNNAIYII